MRILLTTVAVLGVAASILAQDPAAATPPVRQDGAQPQAQGVDLAEDEHGSMREAMGDAAQTLDDWIDNFRLYGFVAARYLDTERGGSHPDGALGIQAATLFAEADVKDVASAFFELRFDYFQQAGDNQVDIGEAYIRLRDVLQLTDTTHLQMKVGRFDLPFGEWYLLEDPNRNRMIGFPALIPYRWDEGAQAFADFGEWGFNAALTDGTYSRNSQSGIGPAATLRVHARPHERLYLSASCLYIHEADQSAICFGGSVITPVAGGVAGTSPNATVQSVLGSLDLKWDASDAFHLQASAGTGSVDDDADAFDRTFYWWMLEPSWTFADRWQLTGRYSAVGTFDSDEGYQFESRPYEIATQSYGFDLSSLQRVALGVQRTFAKGLLGKVEVGFDQLTAIDPSGLPDSTRVFTAAELVFTF